MMGSNNYLGLANHPQVVEAAAKALVQYGVGTCMNPPVSTTPVNEELRAAIARFHGTEDALLFSSCSAANMALIDAVAGDGDVILSDALNHASIIDGCRLSRGKSIRYQHADMQNLAMLASASKSAGQRLIVSDGVFSMEGTVAHVPSLIEVAERSQALLAIDESHSAGVVGPTGRGTPELQGCIGKVDFITGTFSKALGGAGGGYICSTRAWRQQLTVSARMAIFSAPMQPAAAAAALAAIRLLVDDRGLVDTLSSNSRYFRKGLREWGFDAPELPSAIVPLFVGAASDAATMSAALLETGIHVPAVSYPVVSQGQAKLRFQISALHSRADLDFALEAIVRVARRLNLLP